MAYKLNKEKNWAVISLVVLLALAGAYIAVDQYTGYAIAQQQEDIGILQQGAQLGYQQAIVELLEQAATCQAVPVRYNNATLNLIAVECLQVPQQQ